MTSCGLPSAPHMRPDSRIIAGMEASMITSLGTCRPVMPLSESTMARPGRFAYSAAMSALNASFSAAGSVSIFVKRSPKPLLRLTPRRLSVAACFSITSAKKTETAWPNTMGSAIFIMVALTCSENSTPSFFAASISSAKKVRSALRLITSASMISPAASVVFAFSTVTAPSTPTSSMRAAVGIALAQYRVDDAAEHLGIARLDVLLGFRRRIVRIVRNAVALALQFLDRGLELRDRGGDVGQLDDVGLGPHCELAEFGKFVVNSLRRGELVGDTSED